MARDLKFYFYKAIKTPPQRLAREVVKRSLRLVKNRVVRYKDLNSAPSRGSKDKAKLFSFVNIANLDVSGVSPKVADNLIHMYMDHRYDLLGSGWVRVDYSVHPVGVEGYIYDMSPHLNQFDASGGWLEKLLLPNRWETSKKIWSHVSKGYVPIDWQFDYKSGFRWDTKKWYKEQEIGKYPGVDIKVPWELARMQHLPQMAIFSLIVPEKRRDLILEFKNQALDFICVNPVRMGVNWVCTMDVGIRAANLLLAYDLFKQIDEDQIIDGDFDAIFRNSMIEHGQFIVENQEWSEILTSNHYLANICGLLFVAAYLDRNETSDAWLAFAVQEMINEMNKQFYNDGTNFEASTCYHRLSAEMVVYSTALLFGVLEQKKEALTDYRVQGIKRLKKSDAQPFNLKRESNFFPQSYLSKLFYSGVFSRDITLPNGNVAQIGDNDSGRFLKLSPNGSLMSFDEAQRKYINLRAHNASLQPELFWDENHLNHGTVISAISGIFPDLSGAGGHFPLEASMVRELGRGKTVVSPVALEQRKVSLPQMPELKYTSCKEFEFENDLTEGISSYAYPEFGGFLIKSNQMYLFVMAGGNGQNGNAGHTHNDKLSFELAVAGENIFSDPGAYLYTPMPERRNFFRSIRSHNTIQTADGEQNDELTLFSMKDQSRCYLLERTDFSLKVCCKYKNTFHVREFVVERRKLVIKDACNLPFEANWERSAQHSNGYGKLSERKV
ncbi:heparinase II/III domain-containing protein [Cohnella boryungensis]|uniref:Heparinase II/III family protein n=1 Tax=Cohnella boryungensis TaxID=768479 RepID=A0ABV8S8W0_9BACL